MRIAKIAATAMLSIAALCVATVTAHGEPGLASPGISGVDRGVEYTTSLASDRTSVSTTLTGGHFEVGDGTVTVIGPDGGVIGTLPLAYRTADRSVSVVPEVDAAGTTLTVRPASTADIVAPSTDVAQLQNIASTGTIVAGAALGCVVGILIGIWFFLIGALVGCGVGGLIGALIAADQP
ncbi:hypothetical protein [Nocardia jejuensis]|uniref:hypothetical protein n=1 Tax=Nocardia jejuensis TaxID=328049 RepID=UPI00082A417E|nr:hypothetical protein [Nocardia jejuensis]